MDKAEWNRQATKHIMDFVKKNYEFMGEDLSKYIELHIGPPHSPNVYGALFNSVLVSGKFAVPVGVAKSTKASSNAHTFRRWRSTLCVGDKHMQSVGDTMKAIRGRFITKKITLDQALLDAYQAGVESV